MIRVGQAQGLAIYMSEILNLKLYQITAGARRFQMLQLHRALALSAVDDIVHLVC